MLECTDQPILDYPGINLKLVFLQESAFLVYWKANQVFMPEHETEFIEQMTMEITG